MQEKEHPMAEALMKEQAVAAQLGIALRTLQNWRIYGDGPPFLKLRGGAVRYDPKKVQAWLAAQERTSTSDRPPKPRRRAGGRR